MLRLFINVLSVCHMGRFFFKNIQLCALGLEPILLEIASTYQHQNHLQTEGHLVQLRKSPVPTSLWYVLCTILTPSRYQDKARNRVPICTSPNSLSSSRIAKTRSSTTKFHKIYQCMWVWAYGIDPGF